MMQSLSPFLVQYSSSALLNVEKLRHSVLKRP